MMISDAVPNDADYEGHRPSVQDALDRFDVTMSTEVTL